MGILSKIFAGLAAKKRNDIPNRERTLAFGRFLFSGTVELLEQYGFERVRQVGKHAWIVSKHVPGVERDGR